MGKRSDFQRRDRDFYPTPEESFATPTGPYRELLYVYRAVCRGWTTNKSPDEV